MDKNYAANATRKMKGKQQQVNLWMPLESETNTIKGSFSILCTTDALLKIFKSLIAVPP